MGVSDWQKRYLAKPAAPHYYQKGGISMIEDEAYKVHIQYTFRFTKNNVNLRQNRKIEKSAGKPVIHDNRTANVRLYQGLKAYEAPYGYP